MAAQTYDNAFCDSIESYLAVYDVLSVAVHSHFTSNYCILGDRTIVRVDMATSSNKEFFWETQCYRSFLGGLDPLLPTHEMSSC